jgi:hypothetical protein
MIILESLFLTTKSNTNLIASPSMVKADAGKHSRFFLYGF